MATGEAWSIAYARQASADLDTYEFMQDGPVPECHKLQFLQMACEKLVKAHLCGTGTPPASLQASHGYVSTQLACGATAASGVLELHGREGDRCHETMPTSRPRDRIAGSVAQARWSEAGQLRVPLGGRHGMLALSFGLDV